MGQVNARLLQTRVKIFIIQILKPNLYLNKNRLLSLILIKLRAGAAYICLQISFLRIHKAMETVSQRVKEVTGQLILTTDVVAKQVLIICWSKMKTFIPGVSEIKQSYF